jgi:hypothetical protein
MTLAAVFYLFLGGVLALAAEQAGIALARLHDRYRTTGAKVTRLADPKPLDGEHIELPRAFAPVPLDGARHTHPVDGPTVYVPNWLQSGKDTRP